MQRFYTVKMGGCGLDTITNMVKYLWVVFDTKDLVKYEIKCSFESMVSLSNDFNGICRITESEAKEKGFFNYILSENNLEKFGKDVEIY
jgi:hypothetical protein